MFPSAIEQLLLELEQLGRENDLRVSERREKLLNLERPTAELIWLLLQATGRQRVLEIGTSNGYSTIWLAAALRHTPKARFVSVERSSEKLTQARRNLERAGLLEAVELIEGEATEVVRSLPHDFDCVFFDADRVSAPKQLEILLPTLAPDVLLLADNALSHPDQLAQYRELVERLPGFIWTVVPVGKGLHIAWRRTRGQQQETFTRSGGKKQEMT
jgi:predicted O-methyltransferase YrrM